MNISIYINILFDCNIIYLLLDKNILVLSKNKI